MLLMRPSGSALVAATAPTGRMAGRDVLVEGCAASVWAATIESAVVERRRRFICECV